MTETKLTLLLIEDSSSDAELVRAVLSQNKSFAFSLMVAHRLEDALAWLHHAKADVILLDLGLPDSQGLTTLTRLYHICGAETAIIVLTGADQEALGPPALQAGAQDFLNKKHIVSGQALARCLSYAWERKQREKLERRIRQAQRGMEVAHVIQQHLLPKRAPHCAGIDIAAVWRPTEATGGDFYDFIPLADQRIGIALADVASHGFGPALIMASTRRGLRMLSKTERDPGVILTLLNEVVCEDIDAERFVTLFLVCLEPTTRQFVFAAAGHHAHVCDAAGQMTVLESGDLPLGVDPKATYRSHGPRTLEPGQMLLLLSDGFHEAHAAGKAKPFGLAAVYEHVCTRRHLDAQTILESLVDAVLLYCRPGTPHDDMTAVLVKSL